MGFESGVLVSTVAVLVIAPEGETTVTEMMSVALPTPGIVPKFAATVPLPFAQVPWLVEHERYERPEGSGSVTVTAWASAGPALETTIVYVSVCPGCTGFGEANFRIDRSHVPVVGVAVSVGVSVGEDVAVAVKVGVAVGGVPVTVAVFVGVWFVGVIEGVLVNVG